MTVEEPQTTDAESAASILDQPGTETESEVAAPEAGVTESAPAEAAPEAAPAFDAAAAAHAEALAVSAHQAPAPAAMDDVPEAEVASGEGTAAEAAVQDEPVTADSPDVGSAGAVSAQAAPEAPEAPEAMAATDITPTAEDAAPQDEAPLTAAAVPATAMLADDAEAPAAEEAPVALEARADAPAAEEAPSEAQDTRPEPTTMEELLAQQSGDIPSLKHGDVVEGTIVRIDKDEMLVDVGAKSEGVVSNRELYGRNAETQPDLSVGDTVLVYVLQPESTDGHAVLSLRRAGLERKWRSMQEQFDAGEIIDAPVIDHNKGGLIVDCGIRGFVPISQIVDFPRRPQNDQPRDAAQEIAEKLQPYVGRKLRLKILEVNRKANRLILSEKVALYEERREKRDELFSSLQVGQQVKGTVRSIAPFGIFIDLGGIDGLVHKSELSWNKVNNPEGAHEVGDEVEAEVIDINHERGRISLSIRRMQPDPWQSTVGDLKVGDLVDGTVTKIVNFGAFVRVKDGLEGLIHISELSHQRVAHPGDVVHEGQTLNLKIISLDSERHRLGLSLKQAEEAPARPPRERRPRTERDGYDRAQAVQEPEGGIDNTLAAAFAQVRQQIAEQDAAEPGPQASEVTPVAEAYLASEVVAADELAEAPEAEPVVDAEPEAVAEAVAADELAEAPDAEPVVDAEPEAVAEAVAADELAEAPDAEPVVDAEPEAVAEAVAADELAEAPEPEPVVDAEPEPVVDAEPEPVVDAEPEAVAEAVAADVLAEAPEAEPEPASPAKG